MTSGERLKLLRKTLKLTQVGLAGELKCAATTLSAMEIGANPVKGVYAKILETTYNVDSNWLLTGEGEMFRKKYEESRVIESNVSEHFESYLTPNNSDMLNKINTLEAEVKILRNIVVLQDEKIQEQKQQIARLEEQAGVRKVAT